MTGRAQLVPPMEVEPDVDLALDPEEYVCPKPDCRLVHWRPAGPGACDR